MASQGATASNASSSWPALRLTKFSLPLRTVKCREERPPVVVVAAAPARFAGPLTPSAPAGLFRLAGCLGPHTGVHEFEWEAIQASISGGPRPARNGTDGVTSAFLEPTRSAAPWQPFGGPDHRAPLRCAYARRDPLSGTGCSGQAPLSAARRPLNRADYGRRAGTQSQCPMEARAVFSADPGGESATRAVARILREQQERFHREVFRNVRALIRLQRVLGFGDPPS